MKKWKKVVNSLIDFLPHLIIALAITLIACFITDRYNRAMSFINNDITKWILFIFCLLNILQSILFSHHRRHRR